MKVAAWFRYRVWERGWVGIDGRELTVRVMTLLVTEPQPFDTAHVYAPESVNAIGLIGRVEEFVPMVVLPLYH